MSSIVCFELLGEAGSDDRTWGRLQKPPYLRQCGGRLVVELPRRSRAKVYVNGLPVVGRLQVVAPSDLVRIACDSGAETSYVVGGVPPSREPGRGRLCQFTGLPIEGEAVRCACGGLFATAVAEQLGVCPHCKASLTGEVQEPPEEMR